MALRIVAMPTEQTVGDAINWQRDQTKRTQRAKARKSRQAANYLNSGKAWRDGQKAMASQLKEVKVSSPAKCSDEKAEALCEIIAELIVTNLNTQKYI